MRVLIQMRYESTAISSAMGLAATASSGALPGFSIDESYTPVQVPDKQRREMVGDQEVGQLFSFNVQPEVSTYLIRGEIADENLASFTTAVESDDNVIGVFSDPAIEPFIVCGGSPAVGTHQDVEKLLEVTKLQALGMDGSKVMVAIVDTGFNLAYLNNKGKNPNFDASRSWTPVPGVIPGKVGVNHGTMCAFDVCIAAPKSTLLDYALLKSQSTGSTGMEGLLSDAVKAFSNLLQILLAFPDPKPALVVNNSWGMYHPSWDFPVGHPGNYSDNPNHPFNVIVESLEDAGADILFAAGNCGSDCPDGRCQGRTRAIYGANSHPSVLSIAGVTVQKERVGYSTQGPGRLDPQKPDFCAYTHFSGSGVYAADNGTSAASPVAAGVVAAIRSVYSPTQLSPAKLRQILCNTAEDLGTIGFDYNHGFGLVNVPGILSKLGSIPKPPFSNVDYPCEPVIANSGDEWAKALFGCKEWTLDPTHGGIFNSAEQCVNSVDPPNTRGLLTVLVGGASTDVNCVSYICIGGPGAGEVDVAIYPDSIVGGVKYLGWNGNSFVAEPAININGYYWYRLAVQWKKPYADPNAVFYAKSYRSQVRGAAMPFKIWAYKNVLPD